MNKWVFYIGFVASFFLGHYLAPTKIITKEVVRYEERKEVAKEVHESKKTIEIKLKDGQVITKTNQTVNTSYASRVAQVGSQTLEETKTSGSYTNISLLASPTKYGISVSKPVLGPITIGAFALSDGTIGCSAGLMF